MPPRTGDDAVLYEKEDGIAWVTLNHPRTLNAIDLEMRDLLWEIFQAIRDDPEVRAAVISGAGGRAFSAGADIGDFGTAPSYLAARGARRGRDLWGLLLSLRKPLIAAIHGFAYGAGCEMSLCCDVRVAATDARFALPEVTLGYIPSAGGTQLLPRTIASGAALAMILSGEPIDAIEAWRLGLVHRVVKAERLLEEAKLLAHRLASHDAHVLSRAKEAVLSGLDTGLQDGLELEARLAVFAMAEMPRA